MNGVDSVLLATGNDSRAVEAGAHAFAAREGKYSPLATWRSASDHLEGQMLLPLAVGTVGGTLRVHDGAQLALALAGVKSSRDLAFLCAAAGLASNLAALRALATEGIQRGHMSLQARAVATSAGATVSEVDEVAQTISREGSVTEASAREALRVLRSNRT